MDVFVFSPHSLVDVITNSSSELFIADRYKSLEVVKKILMELCDKHSVSYSDSFKDPIIYTEELFLEDTTDSWGGYGYERRENIGSIFIFSNGDNSIDWDVIEELEYIFNMRRYHLG